MNWQVPNLKLTNFDAKNYEKPMIINWLEKFLKKFSG